MIPNAAAHLSRLLGLSRYGFAATPRSVTRPQERKVHLVATDGASACLDWMASRMRSETGVMIQTCNPNAP